MRVIGKIIRNRALGEDYGILTFKAPKLAQALSPGQFINIRCTDGGFDPLLRRPFSPMGQAIDQGEIEVLYRVVGRGTRFLSLRRRGDPIDVVGPLGNGFDLQMGFKEIAIVGRGVGIAPLLFLSQQARELRIAVKAFFSIRPKALNLIPEIKEKLRKHAVSSYLSTDSSELVTDRLLDEITIKNRHFDMLYVCGSKRLSKAVKSISIENSIPAQVSLESRMACGMGVCHTCVVKLKDARTWHYGRVCVDGPVFDVQKVMFDD